MFFHLDTVSPHIPSTFCSVFGMIMKVKVQTLDNVVAVLQMICIYVI